MKAMILAAGRGQRMGTLTRDCPKPLLMHQGQYLIEYPLLALKRAGITDIVINVSYLAEQIIQALGDGSQYGLSLHYSYEPEAGGLETGGGVRQALPLLGSEPFVVCAADVVCDFDMACLHDVDSVLHLLLTANPWHHRVGDYGFDVRRGVLDPAAEKFNYAGICKMHPDIIAAFAPGFFPLRDVFNPAVANGHATAQWHQGYWCNIGTPEQL